MSAHCWVVGILEVFLLFGYNYEASESYNNEIWGL